MIFPCMELFLVIFHDFQSFSLVETLYQEHDMRRECTSGN